MKRAVSISLGGSVRDKKVTLNLLGEEITIERIGTDGDVEKAIRLYNEMDGQVDAFGVGGIDLGLTVAGRYYPLYDAQKLVTGVQHTPVVDGGGLKITLERGLAQFIEQEIGDQVQPKRVLITSGVDRYGSVLSFSEAGYDMLIGDLGFALGRLSKKTMRAKSLEDLIFAGSRNKNPANRALVTLHFDNSDSIFPGGAEGDFTITRIIKRGGGGGYKMNGKKATRSQILNALAAANVDPDGSNQFVLQGKIVELTHI